MAVAAHLRVYEPVTAFPSAQRARLVAPVAEGAECPDHELSALAAAVAGEHEAAIRAAVALPPRVVGDVDLRGRLAALVLPASLARRAGPPPAGDEPLVCPLDLGWRALLAVEDLRETLPAEPLRSVLPTSALDAAAEQLAQLTASGRRAGPHVRSSRWYVPMTWLAAFAPDQLVVEATAGDGTPAGAPDWTELPSDVVDGEVTERGSGESPERPDAERHPPVRSSDPSAPAGVRYVAAMADARRGVARALAALRRTPSEVLGVTHVLGVTDLEEFGRWLEDFHPRSVVELDCTGLAGVAGAAWAAQQSVAEVAGALADLRAGRSEAGSRTLRAVRARWAAVQAFEHAS